MSQSHNRSRSLRNPAANGISAINRLLGQGYEQLRGGQPAQAEQCFKQILAQAREHPDARRGLGHVAMSQRSYATAVEHFQRAVKGDPTRGELHGDLGRAQQQIGRIDDALISLRRATGNDPSYIQGWCGQAEILERQGLLDDAHAALDQALLAQPDSEIVKLLLARLHHRQGRYEEAKDSLRSLASQCTNPSLKAQSHLLLGRTLDRTGAYEDAFVQVSQGKELLAQNTPGLQSLLSISRQSDDFKAQSFRDLDSSRIDRWNTSPISQTQSVAFLVGFPRSGTTLMERVLEAHPDIVATDESPFIASLWNSVRQLNPSSPHLLDTLDKLSPSDLSRLQKNYFEWVEKYLGSSIGSRTLVDKMPLNLLAVPFIARVFPNARIIFADRDPRDIALSCFMRLGERPDADSAEFLTIDGCVNRYTRVAGLWKEFEPRCPLQSLHVRYEDVVRDLETQSIRMAAFLDLEWSDSMLRFSDAREGVYLNAPTHEDAGQHLFIRSLERWRRYPFAFTEDQLAKLSPFIQELGYDDAA